MKESGHKHGMRQAEHKIACPDCGQQGTACWVEIGASPRLVALTGGFHPESGRTSSGELLIICDRCDALLPSYH